MLANTFRTPKPGDRKSGVLPWLVYFVGVAVGNYVVSVSALSKLWMIPIGVSAGALAVTVFFVVIRLTAKSHD